MKSFFVLAISIMLSVVFLFNDFSRPHENNFVNPGFPIKLENLRFSTNNSAQNMRLIKAEFDLESGIESTGEIEIIVDGRQEVNNRLMIKRGSSHYSVDFLLNYPENQEDQHLYSATAKLSIKGISADTKQKVFGINSNTLAGSNR